MEWKDRDVYLVIKDIHNCIGPTVHINSIVQAQVRRLHRYEVEYGRMFDYDSPYYMKSFNENHLHHIKEGNKYQVAQSFTTDSAEDVSEGEWFTVIRQGDVTVLEADKDKFHLPVTYFNTDNFNLVEPHSFKVGDLVMANIGTGYPITGTNALMKVVLEGNNSKGAEDDIAVEVINHIDKKYIGNRYWVNSNDFQPYKNGVLDWLHDPTKRTTNDFTADDIPF